MIKCAGGNNPVRNINNVITTYAKELKKDYAENEYALQFNYIEFIKKSFEKGEVNPKLLFGEDIGNKLEHLQSFKGCVSSVEKEIKAGTITVDMEEIGWTIPVFDHHIPLVSKFLKFFKSVYSVNSGRFNSNFSCTLHKLITANISNKKRLKIINLLTDLLNNNLGSMNLYQVLNALLINSQNYNNTFAGKL